MYGGFDVFKTYLAVKNHFTTDYDYNKYGGRVTAKLESFTKRPDRYFFHKLSKRYNERDILDFFVSNFAVDGNKWIGNGLHIQRKIHIQTTIILDAILSFSKVWDKEISEKVVWPKISHTLAKMKPFVLYNQTQAKMIMKDVFV